MVLLNSYFDASGSGSDKPAHGFVTVGGYVGDVRAWRKFEERWAAYLESVAITVPFRMSNFINGSEGFAAWADRPAEQMRVLCDLASIINRSARVSVATTVRLEGWAKANELYRLDDCRVSPYALAAYAVMSKTIRWIGRPGKGFWYNPFVYESGDNGQDDFDWLMRRTIEVGDGRLDGLRPVFQPKSLKPLQAADFAAWEQRQTYLTPPQRFEDIRRSLAILAKTTPLWGDIDEAKVVEWAERIGVPKRGEPWDRRAWKPKFGRLIARESHG